MARYQWLLFDADGTLFDYERAETAALGQAFHQIGVAFQADFLAQYRRINQELWQALEKGTITPTALKVRRFELLLETIGVAHPASHFSELYLQHLADCSELIDGAHEVVRALAAQCRLAIVTNGLQTVQHRRLARSAIRDCIADIIISEEIGAAKPTREFFDVAFARLGQPPKDRVLMIGDNWVSDIQGASDYGIDTCWYNPGRQPRPTRLELTHEIAALPELAALLL